MDRVHCTPLKQFIQSLFMKMGVPEADALLCAQVHVRQEMRGIRTHGLRRVAPNLKMLEEGKANPQPQIKVLRDSGAMRVVDGDKGLGAVGAMAAMRGAIEKAREHGLGMVTIVSGHHFVSAAPYCLEAARKGMLGICCSNTQPSMGYPNAAGAVIGNNPLGFAAPGADFPLCYDGAMTFSYGRLNQYRREGRQLPEGFYGLDGEGKITRDAETIYTRGIPMPMGDHKGASLAILVELLTGVIGGSAFLSGILPPEKPGGEKMSQGESDSQCCIAIDIARFMPIEDFKARIGDFVAEIKSRPKAKDADEITLPGEMMQRHYKENLAKGIEPDEDVVKGLNEWAKRLSVESPLT